MIPIFIGKINTKITWYDKIGKIDKERRRNLEKSYKNRIKDLRDDTEPKISQQEICKILEISDVTYQKYEYGQSEPRMSTLIKLAKLYETSIDYIVGLTDVREPYPPSKKRKD